jgi:hypothetical protein
MQRMTATAARVATVELRLPKTKKNLGNVAMR